MLKKIFLSLTTVSLVSFQMVLAGSQLSLVHAQEAPPELPEGPYLLITAVQTTGGTGRTQEDFIELYNPTDTPFDLNGHRLVKRTATASADTLIISWSEETIVPAHHFYIWVNSNFSSLPVAADATSTATIADNNGVALRQGGNDTGVIIDDIAWGNTANGFTSVSEANPGANESLVRSDVFEDASEFEIAPSAPRNSLVELLPDQDDPPPNDDPPADDPPADDPPVDDPPLNLQITEIYPNPSGSDSGYEKVEIYNAGDEAVNLEGLKLDDVAETDELSSNAFTLTEQELESDSYIAITIPAGKFAMNNTDGEVVTLFDSENHPLSTVSYTGSTPEGKSYSLFNENTWQWAAPTLGEENGDLPEEEEDDEDEDQDEDEDEEEQVDYGDYDNSGLQISEVYAAPTARGSEYIELFNSGEETAQLAVVSLWVGERHKLLPEHELKPGKFYILEQSALPVQLRNSGQDLKLIEDSEVLDKITYPALTAGTSYARFEDGFLLTLKPTKGLENVLKIPEVVKKEATVAAAKTTAAKTSKKTTTSKAPAKAAVKTKTTTPAKDAEIKPTAHAQTNSSTPEAVKPATNNKESVGKIIAMGAAAVTAGVVALYKLVFSAGSQ